MLGKIIKYEFKSTYKIITPLLIAVLVFTFIHKLQLNAFADTDYTTALAYSLISSLSAFFYMAIILSATIISLVVLITRLYKSMFGDEGYLTLTLPCSVDLLMNGKALVFFIWSTIISLVCYLSFWIVYGDDHSDEIQEFIPMFHGLLNQYNISPTSFYIVLVLILVVSAILSIYKIILAMCIGQLSNTHKVGFAVLAFIGISFAVNIIDSVLTAVFNLSTSVSLYSLSLLTNDSIIFPSLVFTLVKLIVYTIISYLITHYIINNKINLD